MADAVRRHKPSARTTNPVDFITTGLNSLANGAAALGAAISNDAADELDLLVDVELAVTFGTAPTADSAIDLFFVRTVDGTNYETEHAEGRPRDGKVGTFRPDNVTSAQRLVLRDLPAPPRDFKPYMINGSGQAFPASGSTLKGFFHTELADEA